MAKRRSTRNGWDISRRDENFVAEIMVGVAKMDF